MCWSRQSTANHRLAPKPSFPAGRTKHHLVQNQLRPPIWKSAVNNTLCSPRPPFFLVLSPCRKSERFKITCDEGNVFLKLHLPHSSFQVCPASIPVVPCKGIRSSRSNKPMELQWSPFAGEAARITRA